MRNTLLKRDNDVHRVRTRLASFTKQKQPNRNTQRAHWSGFGTSVAVSFAREPWSQQECTRQLECKFHRALYNALHNKTKQSFSQNEASSVSVLVFQSAQCVSAFNVEITTDECLLREGMNKTATHVSLENVSLEHCSREERLLHNSRELLQAAHDTIARVLHHNGELSSNITFLDSKRPEQWSLIELPHHQYWYVDIFITLDSAMKFPAFVSVMQNIAVIPESID